jgi:hypothetical protein
MMPAPWEEFQKPKDQKGPWTEYQTGTSPDEPSTLRQFGGGALQGAVFDPVTGINQLIEHASDNKIGLPDSVKKWLEDYKNKYTEGVAGKAGEAIGTVGSLFVPGGAVAKGLGLLPKVARVASGAERALMGATMGGIGAAIQPVDEDKDFASQKKAQMIAGSLTGGALGSPGVRTALTGAAVGELLRKFPNLTWPVIGGIGASLSSLAARHGGLGHGGIGAAFRTIERKAGDILDRPGATYAGGRGAAAVAGPEGPELLGDDNGR